MYAGTITLKEHNTACMTGSCRQLPIGGKAGELCDQVVGRQTERLVFLSPANNSWRVANLTQT